jgi:hypothetical protein
MKKMINLSYIVQLKALLGKATLDISARGLFPIVSIQDHQCGVFPHT